MRPNGRVVKGSICAHGQPERQRSMIVVIRDREVSEKLGKLNVASLRRDKLIGGNVSADQPSIIDDPNIKSGFYGAPTVVVVFAQHNFLYSVPDAFCCAENMVLAATELGIASCIIARAEETFYKRLVSTLDNICRMAERMNRAPYLYITGGDPILHHPTSSAGKRCNRYS